MSGPRKTRSRPRKVVEPPPSEGDRRRNLSLREALDDLVGHVRWISREIGRLSPQELEHAQTRLEWLADEIWRLTVAQEEDEPR